MNLHDIEAHQKRLGSTVYLGTIDGRGNPNITPIAVGWRDGRVYAATSEGSAKVRHIAAHAGVVLHYPIGETTGYDQLTVRGEAVIVSGAEARQDLWTGVFDYDLASFFGSPENPDLCFLEIVPSKAVLLLAMGQGGREEWRP